MSRRETALNVMLGTLLLLIFAFLSALLLGAALSVIYVGFLALAWFVPGLHLSANDALYSVLSLWCIRRAADYLRQRSWRNAFISFSLVAVFISTMVSHIQPASDNDVLFLAPWWLFILTTTDFPSTRRDFMLSAFVVGIAFARNAGLLGSGTFAQSAIACASIGTFTLWGMALRRQTRMRDGSAPATSLNGA